MSKNEFLGRLRTALASLPASECEAAIKYYDDYFADAGEGREAEILRELGSPEMLAATILGDYSSAPARISDVGSSSAWSPPPYHHVDAQPQEPWYRRTPLWVLILVGIVLCPLILPLIGVAIGIFGALCGITVAVLAMMGALGVIGVSFMFGGAVSVVVGIVRTVANPAGGMVTMGMGMLLAGIGILAAIITMWLFTTLLPWAFRTLVSFLRSIFNRGGAAR